MIRLLYIIRHCAAAGQAPTAALTADGRAQADVLAHALERSGIERIVSSPWTRAWSSVVPLAERLRVPIECDPRLIEPLICAGSRSDWRDCVRITFEDDEQQFEGGESSRAATERAVAVVNGVLRGDAHVVALVSHGRLITLLLRQFDASFGFDTWNRLSYPDVFCIATTGRTTKVARVWNAEAPHAVVWPLVV